tara:strand:+ start:108 stop:1028 length:921 start_codon:yes stop_codon:yes gene_type:complete
MNYKYFINKLSSHEFPIFLFHGVIDSNNYKIRNYTRKHILSKEFDILLGELKQNGNPISMDDLIFFNRENIKIPKNSYIITFDDGFENNFSIARKILEKYSTPATFYVSTNLIENNLMSWIDQIEYCIETIKEASINLPWQKNTFELKSKKNKIDLLNNIRQNVKLNQAVYKPEKIVELIFNQCNHKIIFSSDDPLDKKMNWKQLSELNSHELFNVGGHSHNHISLGSINKNLMAEEIKTSINLLKSKSNISSFHYSYPEGQEHDYNSSVITELAKYNIKCCPTAIEGQNNLIPKSLFHLKRNMVY